jgi:predicted metal-binding membrane protein
MTEQARSRDRVTNVMVVLTVIAWVVLLIYHSTHGNETINSICSAARNGSLLLAVDTLLAFTSISSLVLGWLLMMAAMMLPTLTAPIFHVYERSFKRRRFRSISLFVAGYSIVWMLVGISMLAVQLGVNALFPSSYWPAVFVGVVAFVWQCSPVKQLCLNRNHNHAELAAFGRAADISALRFGITHGLWCVGSCWALMLLPMMLIDGHLLAMITVSIVMIGERLENPQPLCWRVRGLGKLVRIIMSAIKLRQLNFEGQFHSTRHQNNG